MNGFRTHLFPIALAMLATTGCREGDAPEGRAEIAVTNSYLASAVRDLCGDEAGILCLAPPGMCPGHFDIAPGQVRQLQQCRILLLFDFQQQVQRRLARLEDGGLGIHLVRTPPGLCLPDTYIEACRQVCEIISDEYPERATAFEMRLAAVQGRLKGLAAELQEAVADSEAAAAEVLISNHQVRFAEWLGLEPVATFIGSDAETAAHVDHCLRQAADQEVRFVIANRQEGTALAEALADRLQARAVVFSNFPTTGDGISGFDTLVRRNVQVLLEAATR